MTLDHFLEYLLYTREKARWRLTEFGRIRCDNPDFDNFLCDHCPISFVIADATGKPAHCWEVAAKYKDIELSQNDMKEIIRAADIDFKSKTRIKLLEACGL